ncbi:hypothetical protein K0M31_008988 [Melipona bicolor]|uniref:HIG1 domain-containing protein n=1 Tax=Melipona bicolor TaxID=60889 RepID=A0AA40FNT8_9HYME|nr:hypothetical protein K0M31_008988 [Melipona bicolor]
MDEIMLIGSTKDPETVEKLEWINNIRSDLNVNNVEESRVMKKLKENPLIPIGITATCSALCYGLYCTFKGNSLMAQYMMRGRVAAQSFTILAMLSGLSLTLTKKTKTDE